MIEVVHETVEVVGPFGGGEYRVSSKGKLVPFLTVHEGLSGMGFRARSDEEDMFVTVLVDGRMGWWVRRSDLGLTLDLLANAMAVAAGFACWAGPRLDPFGAPPGLAQIALAGQVPGPSESEGH
jgi:hypothetical protein